jgi:energy-coupling factor transport system permease protein
MILIFQATTMNFTNLTLGNYFPTGSLLHRLDPRVKIIGMASLMGVTFAISTPLAAAFHTLLLAAAVWISRIPLGAFLKSLRLFIWLFLFTAVLHLFFTPGTPVRGLPSMGFMTITVEGLERERSFHGAC